MDITVNKIVNYDVKKVQINSLTITKNYNKINIIVPYSWLDVDSNEIRTGTNFYKEDDLIASFIAKGSNFVPFATALKNMFLTDISPTVYFKFLADNKISLVLSGGVIENGITSWTSQIIKDDELDAFISAKGLSRNALISLITSFTLAIFE